ncbi:MAG: COX15/CtaA family protein [Planctomycetota bacterium]
MESVRERAPSTWPARLALLTCLAAVPLIFFGGAVTTLRAGLAIDGWLVLEPGRGDHFLWFYPIEKWFRDTGTFVEHTHRQIGSLVGLLAIATVVATFLATRVRIARHAALLALLAVVLQGVLGGLRVLEKSDDLAFLHGCFAQATFALLGASVILLAPRWQQAEVHSLTRTPLRGLSIWTCALVYVQIVVGAWLRHGGAVGALLLHGVLAIVVAIIAIVQAKELGAEAHAANDGEARRRFFSLRNWLVGALAAQWLLGVLAFASVYLWVGKNPTEFQQSLVPTLHVMGGAGLLLASVRSALWVRRFGRPASTTAPVALRASLGGAP